MKKIAVTVSIALLLALTVVLSACAPSPVVAEQPKPTPTDQPYPIDPWIVIEDSLLTDRFKNIGEDMVVVFKSEGDCYAVTNRVLVNLLGAKDSDFNKLGSGDTVFYLEKDQKNCLNSLILKSSSASEFEFEIQTAR